MAAMTASERATFLSRVLGLRAPARGAGSPQGGARQRSARSSIPSGPGFRDPEALEAAATAAAERLRGCRRAGEAGRGSR